MAEAAWRRAAAEAMVTSKSLARRRSRPSRASAKPIWPLGFLTISMAMQVAWRHDRRRRPHREGCRTKGKHRRGARSGGAAPSRSCTEAAWHCRASGRPSVPTMACRLRPFTFLPASQPRGSPASLLRRRSPDPTFNAARGRRSVVERDAQGPDLDVGHTELDRRVVRSRLGCFIEIGGLGNSQAAGSLHDGTAQNAPTLVATVADVTHVVHEAGCSLGRRRSRRAADCARQHARSVPRCIICAPRLTAAKAWCVTVVGGCGFAQPRWNPDIRQKIGRRLRSPAGSRPRSRCRAPPPPVPAGHRSAGQGAGPAPCRNCPGEALPSRRRRRAHAGSPRRRV